MKQVQVKKEYAFDGDVSDDINSQSLEIEEKRVSNLLINSISKHFGDIDRFETKWKEKVLGE